MKILIKNADLIVDDRKEILKGAILIENDKIADVFYHGDKRIDAYETAFDLKGLSIMPLTVEIEDKSNLFSYHPFEVEWQNNDYFYRLLLGEEYVLLDGDRIDQKTMRLLLSKIAKERIIVAGDDMFRLINQLRSLGISYRDIAAYTVLNYQRKIAGYKRKMLKKGNKADLLIMDHAANRFIVMKDGRIKGGIHVVY